MDRRELIKMIALVTGGAFVGAEFFLTGCKSGSGSDLGFTASHIFMLDEVGETIIPATKTPGAKAAMVGQFMQTMITDCYRPVEQAAFTKGMDQLEEACKKMNGKGFMDCSPQQRHDLLVSLEKEAKDFNAKVEADDKPRREAIDKENETLSWKDHKEFESSPIHYYTMMKQLTLLGFFTSKTGMTETLRHAPVPGRFDGNLPYAKGDKAWAE